MLAAEENRASVASAGYFPRRGIDQMLVFGSKLGTAQFAAFHRGALSRELPQRRKCAVRDWHTRFAHNPFR
jgi:hypothetical protein